MIKKGNWLQCVDQGGGFYLTKGNVYEAQCDSFKGPKTCGDMVRVRIDSGEVLQFNTDRFKKVEYVKPVVEALPLDYFAFSRIDGKVCFAFDEKVTVEQAKALIDLVWK